MSKSIEKGKRSSMWTSMVYTMGWKPHPQLEEIPVDVIKKMFLEIDQDIDYRITA